MTLRLRLFRAAPSAHPWTEAVQDTRYAVALGLAYLVGAALTCLLAGVVALGGTAEEWRHLPEIVPYWNE